MEIKEIPINKITTNPLQPRETFDRESIRELANSIAEVNLLQPIVVRQFGKTYQIIAGERRWRAFNILKKKTIPSIIWEVKDDIDALEKSAIENLQREDLTSVERENVITELWNSEKYKTQRELAKKLGYDESVISNLISAKEDRDKLGNFAAKVSTRTLVDTSELEPEERKQIIKKVERGDIGAERVREEVRLVKLKKQAEAIKKGYDFEIPPELKRSGWLLDFSDDCLKTARLFEYCNKIPKEVWEKAFSPKQLEKVKNNATDLFNEITKFLEMLEVL